MQQLIFIDEDKNELRTLPNSNGKIYLELSNDTFPEHPCWIVLDISDTRSLIKQLNAHIKELTTAL